MNNTEAIKLKLWNLNKESNNIDQISKRHSKEKEMLRRRFID